MSRLISVIIVGALFAGCLVAVNRAWEPGDVVRLKATSGTWYVHKAGDTKLTELTEAPWTFRATDINEGGKNVPGVLVHLVDNEERYGAVEGVFFRLGNSTYFEAWARPEGINAFVTMTLMPMRQVLRVERAADSLRFFALDDKALEKHGIASKAINGTSVIDASTKDWRAAILKNGKKLFDSEVMLELKRTPRSR